MTDVIKLTRAQYNEWQKEIETPRQPCIGCGQVIPDGQPETLMEIIEGSMEAGHQFAIDDEGDDFLDDGADDYHLSLAVTILRQHQPMTKDDIKQFAGEVHIVEPSGEITVVNVP